MSVYNQRFSNSGASVSDITSVVINSHLLYFILKASQPSYTISPNYTTGSSLNLPPSSFDARDTVYRPDSNYRVTSPSSSQANWISERIEAWFGK